MTVSYMLTHKQYSVILYLLTDSRKFKLIFSAIEKNNLVFTKSKTWMILRQSDTDITR